MESILDRQKAFYNEPEEKGPPMLPHGDDPKAVRPAKRRKRVKEQVVDIPVPDPQNQSPIFPASQLPAGFPPEHAFRALAAYSLVRTLSVQLRLSPFTPQAFPWRS
jgi:hypothetical protein